MLESGDEPYLVEAVLNYCIEVKENPPRVLSFLEIWADKMWLRSGESVLGVVREIEKCNGKPLTDDLESTLRTLANVTRMEVISSKKAPLDKQKIFGCEFIKNALTIWSNLVVRVSNSIGGPTPSELSNLNVYAESGFQNVPMNFAQNNVACYLLWPPLLHFKHAVDFVNKTHLKHEIDDMLTACVILKKQQDNIYATEHDRELPFFNWLNAYFCNERTSCVVPQVNVPRFPHKVVASEKPFIANGIIYAPGADNKDDDDDWENLKNGRLKINSEQESKSKSWIQCGVNGVGASDFLRQWSGETESLKPWYCVIECKREDSTLVLAQAAGYYKEKSRGRMKSNIPMFGIALSGTTIRFGVFIFEGVDRLAVYELKAFSFQTGILSLDELRDLAASFLAFRCLMIDAAERRAQIPDSCYWHVDPLRIPSEPNVLVNLIDLIFPPRRSFSCKDENGDTIQYRITSFCEVLSASKGKMFTFMYYAEAQTVPTDNTPAARVPVMVRFDSRYNREAHMKLADKKLAPKLFCAEKYHPDYDDIWFVVMEYLHPYNYQSLYALRKGGKLDYNERLRGSIVQCLKNLNAGLKTAEVVHGDLRPCNIFFSPVHSDLKVVDFEFGTTSSPDVPPVYPLTLNTENYSEWGCDDPLSAAALRGSVITHAQDEKMINYCISYVENPQMQVEGSEAEDTPQSLQLRVNTV